MAKENGLPASKENERAILGAIMLNNDLIEEADRLLSADDFYFDSHRRIFARMLQMRERGMAIDGVTLTGVLQKTGELERAGGASTLCALIDGVPRTDSIKWYADIVRQRSAERKLIRHSQALIERVYDGESEIGTLLADAQHALTGFKHYDDDGPHINGEYETLDDLFTAELRHPERILFGLHRGEVGGLIAVTNLGKSTVLFNTSLALACGDVCQPLASEAAMPRRVLYLDFETPASMLRDDLSVMLRNVSDPQLARTNFKCIVECQIDGDPLCLSIPSHFEWIVERASAHRSDLVIVDTAASGFEIYDENSNAEVTKRIMKPLKKLAIEANCGVLFTHHEGKGEESKTGVRAYRGRGASAFGALSRVVFNLEKEETKGEGYVSLKCGKVKGEHFEPVLMRLDFARRWFTICEQQPAPDRRALTVQDIADYAESALRVITRKELIEGFKMHPTRTIERRIDEAIRLGMIESMGRGRYLSTAFPPFRQSIRDGGMAETVSEEGDKGAKGNGHKHLDGEPIF